MPVSLHAFATVLLSAVIAAAAHAGKPAYPETALIPVAETYHDVTVSDPYRWLENNSTAKVTEWLTAQNALTRRWLDALPARAAVAERIGKLLQSEPVARYGFQYRKQLFAFKRQPPRA
ncbi:MAG: S9 family peptidase, partial [Casimicrobiaceae bacterium]